MHAYTSHQIIGFADSMQLFDSSNGKVVATATLLPGGGDVWNIAVDGIEDISAPTKANAVEAMIEQARKTMPGYPDNNVTVSVQHGLI